MNPQKYIPSLAIIAALVVSQAAVEELSPPPAPPAEVVEQQATPDAGLEPLAAPRGALYELWRPRPRRRRASV